MLTDEQKSDLNQIAEHKISGTNVDIFASESVRKLATALIQLDEFYDQLLCSMRNTIGSMDLKLTRQNQRIEDIQKYALSVKNRTNEDSDMLLD